MTQTQTFGSLRGDAPRIGRAAAGALLSEYARTTGPRHLLVAGPRAAALLAALSGIAGPSDQITIMGSTADRTGVPASLLPQVVFQHSGDPLPAHSFNQIISTAPLDQHALRDAERLLRPGGTLSTVARVGSLLAADSLAEYEFRRDTVLRNFPPLHVRHARFDTREASALGMRPLTGAGRVALGPTGMSTDALPWLAGLAAIGSLRPFRRAWPVFALAGATLGHIYRDPPRSVVPDAGVAYAPCDGTVLEIERVDDMRLGAGRWLRITIAPTLNDVYVCRSPVAGRLATADHSEDGTGQIIIEGVRGRVVLSQRIRVPLARMRLNTKPGALVAQGDKCGMLGVGAQVEVAFPAASVESLIRPGEHVRAGQTALVRYAASR